MSTFTQRRLKDTNTHRNISKQGRVYLLPRWSGLTADRFSGYSIITLHHAHHHLLLADILIF